MTDSTGPFRVLLVNPPPFRVTEPRLETPKFPRHGLACVAGYLREKSDCEIRIVDGKFERLSFNEILRRTQKFKPHVVGVTAFTNEIQAAAHLMGLLKKAMPGLITVVGGTHVTALPESTLEEFKEFDYGVVGEGEITFLELCERLRCGKSVSDIAGLVFRAGEETRKTRARPKMVDLDELPDPAYDLLPPAEEYYVMSQKGCPFACNFCFNPNGRVPRQRSIPHVIGEISRILDRFHPKRIHFADELFSVDMDRTHRLLDGMIRIGFPERATFWVQTHVNFVDLELLTHLKRAGCSGCAMGIETGDSDKLNGMGKGTNLEMIEEAFRNASRAGVPTESFFIIGHPGETSESIRKTIDLACRLNPTLPIIGVMVPYPGTEVGRFAALDQRGYRMISYDWSQLNKQLGHAFELTGMPRWKIEWFQFSGYLSVFLRNRRYGDLLKFIWNFRTSGFALTKKISGGFISELIGARSKRGTPAKMREAIVSATESWQKYQQESAKDVRTRAEPGSIRVMNRKQKLRRNLT